MKNFEVVTRQSLGQTAAARYKQWAYAESAYSKGWRKTGRSDSVDSEAVYAEIIATGGDPDKIDDIIAKHYPEWIAGRFTRKECTVCFEYTELCVQFCDGEYDDHVCLKCAELMINAMKATL